MNKNELSGRTGRAGALFAIGVCSLVLAGTTLSVSACSMGDPEPEEAGATLEGRYAITSSSESATFRTLWFSKDGTFEAVLARCTAGCLRSGSFTFARGDLTLTPTEGPVSKLRINPGAATGGLTTNRLGTRTTGDDGAQTEGTAAASDCKTAGSATTASLTPRAEGEPGGESVSLLNGCASSLLNVLTKFNAGDEGDGQRVGDMPLSKMPQKVAKSICGWGTSCKRYQCWACSTADTGGCRPSKTTDCAYLCPSKTVSRCTGWTESNEMRQCGQEDGCGRYE
jgi:hypothetical protein